MNDEEYEKYKNVIDACVKVLNTRLEEEFPTYEFNIVLIVDNDGRFSMLANHSDRKIMSEILARALNVVILDVNETVN